MPTANETRVRVDDLSKMTATVCGPSSGVRLQRSALSCSARSRISACSAGRDVVVAKEVAGHATPFDASGRAWSVGGCGVEGARRTLAMNSSSSASPMMSGGARRMVESFAALTIRPPSRAAATTRPRHRLGEADADEQSPAAHPGDERRADAEDALAQLVAAARGVLDEPGALDLAEHRVRHRRGERVAAERRAVLALREELGRLRRT